MLKKVTSFLVASLFSFSAYSHECSFTASGSACHNENTEWVCPTVVEGESIAYVNCMPVFGMERDPLCKRHLSCVQEHCPGVKLVH